MRCLSPHLTPLLACSALLACGDGGTDPESAEASLEVTSETSGSLFPDHYTVTLDGGTELPIGANGRAVFTPVAPGSHDVRLEGVSPPCVVAGTNPRTVTVTVGVARLHFAVDCRQESVGGTLVVETVTQGPQPDADGYLLRVTGNPQRRIGINTSITLEKLPPGDFSITLSDMTANCATTGPSTLTVTVSSGQISRVRFDVSCVAVAEGVLLFTWNRLDGQHLYRIGLDGTGLADLTPSHPACCGDWSPDGSRIVYGDPAGFTVMNQDGGDPTSIGLGGSSPRWSPDGTKLVYTSSTAATSTIYVANADGSGARALGPGLAPDWSPDGRRIAFYRDETCNVVMCGADVFTMDSDGTHVQRLTHSSGGFEFYGYPAWSPDGSRLAVRYRAFFFGDRIEIISLQGVVLVRLAGTGGRGGPVWSPDGSAIAFAGYGDSTGTPYITVVPSAGGTPVVLAGTPANAHPTSWK